MLCVDVCTQRRSRFAQPCALVPVLQLQLAQKRQSAVLGFADASRGRWDSTARRSRRKRVAAVTWTTSLAAVACAVLSG